MDKTIKTQADQMIDLEKSFNNHIEQAKTDISKQLDELLKIFDDKTTMKKVIKASQTVQKSTSSFLQEVSGDQLYGNDGILDVAEPSPSELSDDLGEPDDIAIADEQEPSQIDLSKSSYNGSPDTIPVEIPETAQSRTKDNFFYELPNSIAIFDGPVSFLETGFVDSIKQKLSNVGSPSLLVQLMDVYIPDSSLESEIKKIMSARDKTTKQMFSTAKDMFDEVATITKAEIKTNLNIQLNSFTADLDGISSLLGGKSSSFLELNSLDRAEADAEAKTLVAQEIEVPVAQVTEGSPLSFLGVEAQQLNVAVGTPDIPYPTVADVLHAHLQERQAAERLYRSKILQMIQHLMTTEIQILKDELRPRIAKAIATVATVSSALAED